MAEWREEHKVACVPPYMGASKSAADGQKGTHISELTRRVAAVRHVESEIEMRVVALMVGRVLGEVQDAVAVAS